MLKHPEVVHFVLRADCEATQPAVSDPELGERASRGMADCIEKAGGRMSFAVIPTDLEAHAALYLDLKSRGHEVGLHVHPAAQGYEEFLGIYGPDMQERIIREAADRFSQVMACEPGMFSMGYSSANDHSFPVLAKLGFRHGKISCPGRMLPECAAVWSGAPLFMHYGHPYNRLLQGTLDFVEIPPTVDWESMMWGGKQPQDLRIELVDAKNHYYTMMKSLERQKKENLPVRYLHAFTHNVFDYGDPGNFRRETLEKVIDHARRLSEETGCGLKITTLEEISAGFRKKCPLENAAGAHLRLDTRGRS